MWAAKVPFVEIPSDYWTVDYATEDDGAPFNQFSTDFGFGFYDEDFVEGHWRDDHCSTPVEQLLEPGLFPR